MYHIMKKLSSFITHYITTITHKRIKICSICIEPIKYQLYTLSCGHSFHTHCIVSWFRHKKATCPMCRDRGNNIKEEDWESNPAVQEFLNSENPTKDQIVKAYHMRDINMNIGIEECFDSCVRGLGINPENYESQIKYGFVRKQECLYKTYIQRCLDNPEETKFFFMSINFNEYLIENLESDQFKEKLMLYKTLEKLKNENDHKGIYESISREELLALGW